MRSDLVHAEAESCAVREHFAARTHSLIVGLPRLVSRGQLRTDQRFHLIPYLGITFNFGVSL